MMKNLLTITLLSLCFVAFGQKDPTTKKGAQKLSEIQPPQNSKMNSNQGDISLGNSSGISSGQSNTFNSGEPIRGCGFVIADQMLRERNPGMPSIEEFENWMKNQIIQSEYQAQTLSLMGPRCDVMYIPYVVHILHEGEDVNTVGNINGPNVSAAQVESQIDVINEAFRKMNFDRNDSPLWDDVSADFQLQFVPAIMNPDTGDMLAEPGINRVNAIDEGFNLDYSSIPGVIGTFDDEIKPATIWDPEQVLNMWVADFVTTSTLLGFAQFPSMSGLGGLNADGGLATTDGVVMTTTAFLNTTVDDGSFTPPVNAAYSLGQTTTHEIGHWVGLRHIWGDSDCSGDDFVTDTPDQSGFTSGCPTNKDTCTADDLPDMVANYMDYSDDDCLSLFTEGQKARKDVVFNLSPRRGSLLNSTVGDYPDREPYVFIEVDHLVRDVVEADGCGEYTDYMIRTRIKDCTDGMGGNIVATIDVDASSTVDAADYDFTAGQTVTFAGDGPEVIELPIRIYSDGVTEGDEALVLNISLDADGSDAVLHPDATYTQAIWTVQDALIPEDPSEVSFVETADDIVLPEACADGDMNLFIDFDFFASETSWEITDDMNMVVASGDSYSNGADPIDVPISLTAGNYTLTFYDSFGDGIFAPGGYILTDSSGDIFAQGGDFEDDESTSFCVITGPFTFNGIIPIDATVKEVENCGDDYAEYYVTMNLNGCVSGEQDVVATIAVDPSSTATEGDDFVFPSGKTVTFDGTGNQSLTLPIRFIGDGVAEGTETLILNFTVDNSDIVTLGTTTTEITILDVDVPLLTIASIESVKEAEYNCEGSSNVFDVTVTAEGCPGADLELEFSLVAADGTVATEGDDFVFVGATTHTFNTMNIDEAASFKIEVFDDQILEGDEALWLAIEIADGDVGSVANQPYEVIVQDPQGVSPPELIEVIDGGDFENGLPSGWSVLESADTADNTWVVSGNTGLNGMAAHITNDTDAKPLAYGNTSTGSKDVYLISPLFEIENKRIFDILFQVEGEPGIFGNFDFGFAGIISGETDITDAQAVLDDIFGVLLLSEPNPILLSEIIGEPLDLEEIHSVSGFNGNMVRLAFLWRSDSSVTNNPPLAIDDVSVLKGNFVETDKMIGPDVPSYPITNGVETFYYNATNLETAMMVNSSSDHGCSSGYVYQSGTGIQQFISEYQLDYAAEKVFAVTTETPDMDATIDIGLYFTEDELAGWERLTGNTRDNLHMFKTDGYALGKCYDSNIKLDLTLDNFPDETSWEITDAFGNEIASGGDYNTPGQVISESWDLPVGDYTFTLNDVFGDGICCGFGNGSFRLSSGAETIAEGGEFDNVFQASFCISDFDLDLCNDYREIEFAPITITPVLDGYKLLASFETGLGEFTGFGISGIPVFTPGEFIAVQNQEQVDITFTNKYDESNIDHYIFEKRHSDIDWIELETVPADGTGSYNVIDFVPYVGNNRYRVGAVLNNGDVVYPCYEAEVFFRSTNDFDITPNPAVNNINIVISDSNIEGPMSLGIYDEYGRMVYSEDIVSYAGIVRHDVDVSNLAVGEYYVVVKNDLGFQKHATFIKAQN